MNLEFQVKSEDYVNAGKISSQVKQTLKHIGVSNDILRRVAVACYEAEINMVIHSLGGNITFQLQEVGSLKLTFHDFGPGIPNIEKAMTPGFSTASQRAREFGFGAGMGLPNIKRVCDVFDIKSGENGTILTIGFNLV